MVLDQACFGGLWKENGYKREIDSPNSQLLLLKTVCGDSMGLGCVWFILEEAHITLLGIHPHYRRQGLGKFLLLILLQSAISRGAKWATLEVRVSNAPAQSLYQSLGFVTIGRRKHYYQDTKEDALILWNKELQKQSFHHNLEQHRHEVITRLHNSGWNVVEAEQQVN